MLGLYVSEINKTVSDSPLQFDSRRGHLLVDLNAEPKHFDVVSPTGTNLSLGAPGSVEETLLTIPHGLPYIPKVETYIFVSGTFDFTAGSGSYYRKFYPYSGTAGFFSDEVIGEVDATNYYIRHRLEVFSGSHTSTAASTPLKIKYYIFSNKGTY